MAGLVNSWCGFSGDLEEAWLGDTYPVGYYDHFEPAVRDAFAQITEWTQQDLAKISQGLERHGVHIRRPEFHSIDHFVDNQGRLLRPPIAPRDNTLVLGDHLYQLGIKSQRDPWQSAVDAYRASGSQITVATEGPWACISPPCLVRFGRDIFVDWIYHQHVWGMVTEPLVELARHFRVHISMFDGHSDCVFCPIEQNLILSTEYKDDYSKTYPDWQVYWLKNNPVRNRIVQTENSGFYQWYVPGDTVKNRQFADHIEQFAQDWVGNYQETIFDVNLLKVNHNTIFSVGEDAELFEFLHKRGYNVEVYDFRCKTFWDSGMHCLTSDIRRGGTCPDFFPGRGAAGLDWLIDEQHS